MSLKKQTGFIVAGLALFSMFFGAGDLLWPLILGGTSGDKNFFSMIGLLISGVSLPLLGLMAIMLFRGDYRAFFCQTGKISGWVLIIIIQAVLGPFGSLPRLFTLCHASLKMYLPDYMTLGIFSILSSVLVFALTIKRHRIVDLVGYLLSPLLILCLGAILVVGYINHPTPESIAMTDGAAFLSGLNVGYSTLDLIASFIFAPLVLAYFQHQGQEETLGSRRELFKKMVKASCLAAGLLAAMYFGLTYIASYYTPYLPPHAPEERLAAISLHLLGPYGAFFSCMAIALSCLTTAIPIAAISASFIHEDVLRKKGKLWMGMVISLGISAVIANLGFMGIASMLSPVLQIVCPGLILLSILGIFHKLYEMRMQKAPVFMAFALSTIGYLVRW